MGLDQYLYATQHIVNYSHDPAGALLANKLIATMAEATGVGIDRLAESNNIIEVRYTAAYWRKANAVHRWFVTHVQEGNDDCGTYHVGRETLEHLASVCDQLLTGVEVETGTIHVGTTYSQAEGAIAITEEGPVIANPELAERLLPTTEGFFFGSTAYNRYYLEDVTYTRDRLREVLGITEGHPIYFEYHSSW